MSMLRLYTRVLELLGKEARLGWILAFANLPLTFHTGTHSGRLMKVMLNGTDSLWRLWLGFFREHFAAILSLVVLLPLAFYINWRLAILLFALCVIFTVLTTLVVRKTYGMQSEVEAH